MVVAVSVFVVSVVLTAQDRFALKSANGIAFSEFKGYEVWQMIAPSQADGGTDAGRHRIPAVSKASWAIPQ
jgi:hypothetical protein